MESLEPEFTYFGTFNVRSTSGGGYEVRSKNVRVNAILPTIIDTPANRQDMPGADTSAWVRPEAIARVIMFLLSNDAGAITGESIRVSLAG